MSLDSLPKLCDGFYFLSYLSVLSQIRPKGSLKERLSKVSILKLKLISCKSQAFLFKVHLFVRGHRGFAAVR